MHAVLEEMHKLPRTEREYPAMVKQLKPTWETMCAADSELKKLVPEDAVMDFLIDSRALLRGYFEMENPQGFDATECEMYVNTVLPNGVPVRGFIDRVDTAPSGEIRVVDYKTGKKPKPQWSQQARFQMLFYALVYWRLFDHIPTQLRLMYLKVTDSMFLSPSQEQLEFFERDLADLWAKIEMDGKAGVFRPQRSKLCGWCSFQSVCPEFGGVPPLYPGWPGSAADPRPTDTEGSKPKG